MSNIATQIHCPCAINVSIHQKDFVHCTWGGKGRGVGVLGSRCYDIARHVDGTFSHQFLNINLMHTQIIFLPKNVAITVSAALALYNGNSISFEVTISDSNNFK